LQNKRFIADVVNFESESLSDEQRGAVLKMRENPNFVADKVGHASKPCLSLFNWVVSQLAFTTVIRKVQPLRLELEKLEQESEELMEQHAEQMKMIDELEAAIKVYKGESCVCMYVCMYLCIFVCIYVSRYEHQVVVIQPKFNHVWATLDRVRV
jgi:hypothetical protein